MVLVGVYRLVLAGALIRYFVGSLGDSRYIDYGCSLQTQKILPEDDYSQTSEYAGMQSTSLEIKRQCGNSRASYIELHTLESNTPFNSCSIYVCRLLHETIL